eukprot:9241887-Lingulodinium_polyedra.AAC.1
MPAGRCRFLAVGPRKPRCQGAVFWSGSFGPRSQESCFPRGRFPLRPRVHRQFAAEARAGVARKVPGCVFLVVRELPVFLLSGYSWTPRGP